VVAGEADSFGEFARRGATALSGPLAEIERAITAGDPRTALARATAWHTQRPDDVLALIGLGDALEASHDLATAARAYGSIIDLYPARADFRRFAGERLERLGQERALIIDTYRRAVADRPDHLTGHRLLAYALVRDGQYADAFTAILAGLDRKYPANRFAGAERVLEDDAGMIGAAYAAHVPARRADIVAELAKRHLALATQPSTRFIMYWETDGNDVDFHIRDARGGHAWYSNKQLRSGGELYADITTGYGPECFAIPGTPTAGPYQLAINYFSQGPMGYGMGLLQIQTFDGRGNLKFEDRPYVIMNDHAFVDLGSYR
jgi:tetratricopeptide (TPR) repeat protein